MREGPYIEGIKYQWRKAMKDREDATKRINHFLQLLIEARKEREQ